FTFLTAFDSRYSKAPGPFWSSLLLTHLLGWLLLGSACRILPRSWQDTLRPNALSVSSPSPPSRAQTAPLPSSANPIVWLAAPNSGQNVSLCIFVFAPSPLGLLLLKLPLPVPAGLVWNVTINLILKIWLAFQACSTVITLRRSGAFELLLATPFGPDDISRG